MFKSWLINLAITFIIRQIAKFNETLDWEKVSADLEARVRALIPGDMFDSSAVAVVNAVLAGAKQVLADEEALAHIVKLAAAGDWERAIAALKDLLVGAWNTQTEEELEVQSLLA